MLPRAAVEFPAIATFPHRVRTARRACRASAPPDHACWGARAPRAPAAARRPRLLPRTPARRPRPPRAASPPPRAGRSGPNDSRRVGDVVDRFLQDQVEVPPLPGRAADGRRLAGSGSRARCRSAPRGRAQSRTRADAREIIAALVTMSLISRRAHAPTPRSRRAGDLRRPSATAARRSNRSAARCARVPIVVQVGRDARALRSSLRTAPPGSGTARRSPRRRRDRNRESARTAAAPGTTGSRAGGPAHPSSESHLGGSPRPQVDEMERR